MSHESAPQPPKHPVVVRVLAGAFAGLVVTFLAAVLLPGLPPASDSSLIELQQWHAAMRIVAAGTCVGGILGMLLGNRRVPRFLLYFVLAFAALCLIPWWRSPKSGELFPLGTAYVNRGFPVENLILCHLAVAALLAACGTWVERVLRKAKTTAANLKQQPS